MRSKKTTTDERTGRLSAGGRVRRWVAGKPKLAVDVGDVTHEVENKPNVFGVLGRLLILIVAVTAGVAVICWFILGVTVMPTVRAGGHTWLVKRAAWTEGDAPAGAQAMVLAEPVQRDALSRVTLLFTPGGRNKVVTIVADPKDVLAVNASGTLTVNGVATPYQIKDPASLPTPGSAYLAECVTGGCPAGKLLIVKPEFVLGKVVNQVPVPFIGMTALSQTFTAAAVDVH